MAVITAANGRCAHCGADHVPLEIRFKIPRAEGGGPERDNLEAVCPNCHRLLDSVPSEMYFVRFIADLLDTSPAFEDVSQASGLSLPGIRADLLATETGDASRRELLIECKSFPVLSTARVDEVLADLRIYRQAAPERQVVLAFPGQTTPEVVRDFSAEGIEIWDIDAIGRRFAQQIGALDDTYYSMLITDALARDRPEAGYLAEIKAIAPGREGWSAYQKLVGRVLEVLFCPPLESPLFEERDSGHVNRRDIIFANHASDGFWAAIRQRYGADYVLVDAKNGAKVKKADVLQIANYLKPHGLGGFAIIMGRGGTERGVPAVLKEQWAFHGKMILVLNDADLEDMVLAYGSGREQTTIISNKIQTFRLGM